ncbi:IS1595 family transposase [Ahrensia sp. R2A130]|uniref:IS1595 family transposase n=1 Tax=Ahrensia sp. R2A130 TaxID=744979 RepID=UPI0001E0C30D|nr:IS1595 family transposase [Ahrensia sp. R2A130]EFL90222.1 transposase [Ahrensia sp. R2A130]
MKMQFDSLFAMMEAFPDEQTAIDHLRSIRWGENNERAHCPHCGSTRVMHFKDGKTHKCSEKECRKRFSIKVGTIFEDSKIPLRKWFMAIWLITSHKKGIASTTLAKDIHVTQKTAWFMTQRLRFAARTRSFNRKMQGPVEIDETFMGGKEKNKHANKRQNAGRGPVGKEVVWGALERNGELRVMHIPNLHGVKQRVFDNVKEGEIVVTDEYGGYRGLSTAYFHQTVNHGAGQYAHTGNYYHTNSIEGAWSQFKRQVYGIHHWVSGKHLHRYLSEFAWRYNRREHGEGDRVNDLLKWADGGKLSYKELIA